MRAAHPPIWSSEGQALVGSGECTVHDPGVGNERYRRAQDVVQDSAAGLGFASFTFDPDERGSVVVIPETLRSGIERVGGSAIPRGRIESDGVDSWERGFMEAIASLERGELEKVVLARRVDLRFDDVVAVDKLLASLESNHAGRFLFAIEGLVGASPELLVSLKGGDVASFPLAGTAESDQGLTDPRIRQEHQLTADYVVASLSDHVDDLWSEPEVVKVGTIKHLGTKVSGKAHPGTTTADLLSSLHPTPAVAGVPKRQALDLIGRIEPTGRGRYAGPVGWMDAAGNAEFAIALRCGLVGGPEVRLHAGGGLVKGADRAKELAETGWKLESILSALGVEA